MQMVTLSNMSVGDASSRDELSAKAAFSQGIHDLLTHTVITEGNHHVHSRTVITNNNNGQQ